jgi:eukaryotic-like serine/threonine-protein kinase
MTRIAEHGEPTDAPGSARPNYVGLTIDERYQILKPLGSGGMGTVVLARHTGLKRLVAIKFLERAHVSESGATQRLFREAQAAASIGHPNIIEVLDVGVSPWGDPYLVMEYLEGEDLATFTDREGQLSVPQACLVLEAVLQGLTAAHELGIVHRDLKPQNIVLARKRSELVIKIIDFGIAKVNEPGLTPLTRSGELVGTPSFMSPEQAKGEDVDARSDIFSVGVLFHRLVSGKNPFSAANYHSLLHRIATAEPDLAVDLLPDDVRSFIERCLEKEPARRFQSVREALTELSSLHDFPERESGRSKLLVRLRTIDPEPDTIVDRSWTPSQQERPPLPPKPSYIAPLPPPPANEAVLEPTLAASTSSSEKLHGHAISTIPRRDLRRWWPLGVLLTVAFGGGWWAAYWNAKERPATAVAPTAANDGSADLQIGKDAVVKLYQASPAPPAASESATAAPSVSTSSPTPALANHQAARPAPANANNVSPANSAAAPKPASTLGKSGKNTFFSEVFE